MRLSSSALPPRVFDGRKVWKAYLAAIAHQFECRGCSLFAVSSALQDRFRLFSGNLVQPSFNPVASVLCSSSSVDVCKKSQTLQAAAEHLFEAGAVEQACVLASPVFLSTLRGNETPLLACEATEDGCPRWWQALDVYTVESPPSLEERAEALKMELWTRGPFAVGFVLFPDFIERYDGRSVYVPENGQVSIGGHAVKVVGWGHGYWICANSWGTSWGQDGYFRIDMANPLLRLEENHICVVPRIPGIESTRWFYNWRNVQVKRTFSVDIYTLQRTATPEASGKGLSTFVFQPGQNYQPAPNTLPPLRDGAKTVIGIVAVFVVLLVVLAAVGFVLVLQRSAVET